MEEEISCAISFQATINTTELRFTFPMVVIPACLQQVDINNAANKIIFLTKTNENSLSS